MRSLFKIFKRYKCTYAKTHIKVSLWPCAEYQYLLRASAIDLINKGFAKLLVSLPPFNEKSNHLSILECFKLAKDNDHQKKYTNEIECGIRQANVLENGSYADHDMCMHYVEKE